MSADRRVEGPKHTTPAIVLCCSKAGLAIIRALGRSGIPVIGVGYGPGQIGLASRHLRVRIDSPEPELDENGFVERVAALGAKWPGAVLFASDDASLVATSRHKERLSKSLRVVAEDWLVVRNLIEKHRTYEIAERIGVPSPRLRIVSTAADALAFAGEIGFPCLLKPSVGHVFFKKFGRKMLLIHSAEDLRGSIRTAAEYGGALMLCEFIPGDDTCGANYNSFAVDGRTIREFTAQKIRIKPTLIGFPTAVESRRLPAITEPGRRMIAALGFRGFSCMEFKRDVRDGEYKLMEVNGRHNYSGQLAVACGMDFPLLSYLGALGEPLPSIGHEQAEGIRWFDEERDVPGAVAAVLRGREAARSYLASYAGRKVFAVSCAADPLPAVRLAGASLLGLLNRKRARRPRDDLLRAS